MKIEEMADSFLNSSNFAKQIFLTLAPPSGYALNLTHWSSFQKLAEHLNFHIN